MTVSERVVFDAEPIVAHADDEFGSANVEEYLTAVADGETEGYVSRVNLTEVRYISLGNTTENGLMTISIG